MEQIEQNIINSFRLAKSDIIRLQDNFIAISEAQKSILEMISELKAEQQRIRNEIKPAVVNGRKSKTYVATKGGSTFHISNCPFAQNIKPKNKVTSKTKNKMLNAGYKQCRCVK